MATVLLKEMGNVRKDVMVKLVEGLERKRVKNADAKTYDYHTPRCKHSIWQYGDAYMFRTIHYEGQFSRTSITEVDYLFMKELVAND